MNKAIYLCSKKHRIKRSDIYIYYNDIEDIDDLDFCCDWNEVDLTDYDVLIGTPPCNYYSIANYRRETSIVAQKTKDILPRMIDKFIKAGKPFIIENVDNISLMPFVKNSNKIFWFRSNHHIFITNVFMMIPKVKFPTMNKQLLPYGKRDDNPAVDFWINYFLDFVIDNCIIA